MPVGSTGAATDGCARDADGADVHAVGDAWPWATPSPRSRRGDALHRTRTPPTVQRSIPTQLVRGLHRGACSTWAQRDNTHYTLADAHCTAHSTRARHARARTRHIMTCTAFERDTALGRESLTVPNRRLTVPNRRLTVPNSRLTVPRQYLDNA